MIYTYTQIKDRLRIILGREPFEEEVLDISAFVKDGQDMTVSPSGNRINKSVKPSQPTKERPKLSPEDAEFWSATHGPLPNLDVFYVGHVPEQVARMQADVMRQQFDLAAQNLTIGAVQQQPMRNDQIIPPIFGDNRYSGPSQLFIDESDTF